jgi:hypothetical protein
MSATPVKRRMILQPERLEISRMYFNQGMKMIVIARLKGIHIGTVSVICGEFGIRRKKHALISRPRTINLQASLCASKP